MNLKIYNGEKIINKANVKNVNKKEYSSFITGYLLSVVDILVASASNIHVGGNIYIKRPEKNYRQKVLLKKKKGLEKLERLKKYKRGL